MRFHGFYSTYRPRAPLAGVADDPVVVARHGAALARRVAEPAHVRSLPLRDAAQVMWIAAVSVAQRAARALDMHCEVAEGRVLPRTVRLPPRAKRGGKQCDLIDVVHAAARAYGGDGGAWERALGEAFALHVYAYEGVDGGIPTSAEVRRKIAAVDAFVRDLAQRIPPG